ncbi:zinc finger BED domain-containing protein 1-like [Solea senegalensis]|uniref:Zinc finger BED domain-containing protein 1-like n=1 Tax=Solea senegalensis TaxID=28829 RepID=A0AAV6QP25_SOLSE|nr:zinc finger BED domain-containing protein 1-like [Solea senegalensis]
MDAAAKPAGLLQGKFIFKKLPNGNLDKTRVVCTLCNAELVYCRSSSSLKYHLNAKHPFADVKGAGASTEAEKSRVRQTTMFECNRGKPVSTALSAKLTGLLAQWIALNCRPISVVEDEGLELLLQAATGDPSYKLPARRTIVRRINEQHAAQKAAKEEKLAGATCVALTGDHCSVLLHPSYCCERPEIRLPARTKKGGQNKEAVDEALFKASSTRKRSVRFMKSRTFLIT